ncbi:hypothetical protein OWR29_32390 [Actinoplanes sp. Pm04-4]|uniref:Uncharacterized protein n=1 Tax=Paractinoplanes pyxinae TaxID=2997416 RepID=A0ABT4B889_9ACTN|nr:hypothetical protein [Actinoplanes pyxinae]MCY1142718.1 hypothetical protein [Actinoplanes pyxinae]
MRPTRRWWLIGLVAVWIAVVGGLAVWSVGHERATVPEQRDIGLAVADLQRAAGTAYAAATGTDRAVVLGEVELARDCRITPVRSGLAAARAVTIYVDDTKAPEVVEDIAARLPGDWAADWGLSSGGTRISLHADAGNFVGLDLSAAAVASTLTLRLTTGCRPLDGAAPSTADASAAPAPARLATVVKALGAQPAASVARTVVCPSGGVAGSWTVDGLPKQDGRKVPAQPVRVDDTLGAYLAGADSVVVRHDADQLSVTVSTACQ